MSFNGGSDCIFEQLRQNVIQRHLNVREFGIDVTRNTDFWSVSVLVLGDLLDESGPTVHDFFQIHGNVDDADMIILEKKSP